MSANPRLLLHQGPQIKALLSAGLAAYSSAGMQGDPSTIATPGPEFTRTVTPPKDLVSAYLKFLGSDAATWRGRIPPHLFCWWAFPLMGRTLEGLPLDLRRVINGGLTLYVHDDLPAGVPLTVRARLDSIDHDERRTIITQRVATGTSATPDAIVAECRLLFMHKRANAPKRPKSAPVLIPEGAREIASRRFGPHAGRDFAMLTGDFNPIHWIKPAAKAGGFKSCILHGFGSFAFAYEAIVQTRLSGRANLVCSFDARFAQPVVLPSTLRVFDCGEGSIHAGTAHSAPSSLIGHLKIRE